MVPKARVSARIRLLGLLGLSPDAPVELIPAFSGVRDGDIELSVDRLIEANTLLAVRRAEYQVAEESLRLEIREQYPDITLGTGFGSEDGDDRLQIVLPGQHRDIKACPPGEEKSQRGAQHGTGGGGFGTGGGGLGAGWWGLSSPDSAPGGGW